MYQTYNKYGITNTAGQAFYKTFDLNAYQSLLATYGNWGYLLAPLRFIVGLASAFLYIFRTWYKTLFSLDTAQNRTSKFVLSWIATLGMGLTAYYGWGIIVDIASALSVKIVMNIGTISSAVAGALFTAALGTLVVAFVYMAAKSLASWWMERSNQVTPLTETITQTKEKRLSLTGRKLSNELMPLVKTNQNLNDLSKISNNLETLYQDIQSALADNDNRKLHLMGVQLSRMLDDGSVISIIDIAKEISSTIKSLQGRLADFLVHLKESKKDIESESIELEFKILKKDFTTFENNLTDALKEGKHYNPLSGYVLYVDFYSCSLVKEKIIVSVKNTATSLHSQPKTGSSAATSTATSPKEVKGSGKNKHRPTAINTHIINGDSSGSKVVTPRTPRHVPVGTEEYQENLRKVLTGEKSISVKIAETIGLTTPPSGLSLLKRNNSGQRYEATFETSGEDKQDDSSDGYDAEAGSNDDPKSDSDKESIHGGSPKQLSTILAPVVEEFKLDVGQSDETKRKRSNSMGSQHG